MLSEFKTFIKRGNVIDLAVGVIIGAAFGTVVKSLVDDIIMPPIGLALGDVEFQDMFAVLREGPKAAAPYVTLADAQAAGAVTVNYGNFITTFVTFLIVGFTVFLLVRAINRMHREEPAAATVTKDCPECAMSMPLAARRCPHCTVVL